MGPTGPLFKWFGSKWNASRHYPKPVYSIIVEPFAGSAGYSLRYGDGKSVILCETNVLVRRLWQWLIRDATKGKPPNRFSNPRCSFSHTKFSCHNSQFRYNNHRACLRAGVPPFGVGLTIRQIRALVAWCY